MIIRDIYLIWIHPNSNLNSLINMRTNPTNRLTHVKSNGYLPKLTS